MQEDTPSKEMWQTGASQKTAKKAELGALFLFREGRRGGRALRGQHRDTEQRCSTALQGPCAETEQALSEPQEQTVQNKHTALMREEH